MKKTLQLFFVLFILLNSSSLAKEDRGYVIWDFGIGYDFGEYEIPNTDEGDYSSLIFSSQIGFNFSKVFIGLDFEVGMPNFDSVNQIGTIDRVNDPKPTELAWSWGPSFTYKMGSVHLYYSFLSQTMRYKDVVSPEDSRALDYKYEGAGHKFGFGLKLFSNVYLTYFYKVSEFDEFRQKIDGVYNELETRDNPFKINTHQVTVRFPLNLTFFPKLMKDIFL